MSKPVAEMTKREVVDSLVGLGLLTSGPETTLRERLAAATQSTEGGDSDADALATAAAGEDETPAPTGGGIARIPHGERSMAELERQRFERDAKVFAASGLVPKALANNPAGVLAVCLSIRDTGMPVTLATIGQWWVDPKGVARPQVQFMIGLAEHHGVELWCPDEECDDTKAVAYGRRYGSEEVRKCTYTFERATLAGLHTKDNWKHRGIMLKWRALGELIKTTYPAISLGLPPSFINEGAGRSVDDRDVAQANAVEVDLDDVVIDGEVVE